MKIQFGNSDQVGFTVAQDAIIVPNSLAPFFVRVQPKHLKVVETTEPQSTAILQEIILAGEQDKSLSLESCIISLCNLRYIDPRLQVFRSLSSLKVLRARTGEGIIDYLSRLEETYFKEETIPLQSLSLGFLQETKISQLLPRQLKKFWFPLATVTDVLNSQEADDSWICHVLSRCSELVNINDFTPAKSKVLPPFGKGALRCLGDIITLEYCKVSVHPSVGMEIIHFCVRRVIERNGNLTKFGVQILGRSFLSDKSAWKEDIRQSGRRGTVKLVRGIDDCEKLIRGFTVWFTLK